MIQITFPDGQIRQYPKNTQILTVVQSVSQSLAKKTTYAIVNGIKNDVSVELPNDCSIKFVTNDSGDADCLEILRHDAAHILAQALKEIYSDKIQITIGPVIENGFYYDIAMEEKISQADLPKIEKQMHEIVKRNLQIKPEIWNRDDAISFFTSIGENYKAEIIRDLPKNEVISLYRQGDFIDLCRGPHAPYTGMIKYFKLLKISGAYWRGDAKNAQLQRIYGTAWHSKAALDEYLAMLEEAEKRDHRKIGPELGLFHIQDEAVGSIFWHEKGWTLYRIVENYIRDKILSHGYQEVRTPQLVNKSLWEKSGHWEKFGDNMFSCQIDDEILAIKPMNCPCHVQIFNHTLRSYRELPIRMAEFGSCHRNESSGSLHGIMRTRAFTQDDAHIFCMQSQIESETMAFCKLLFEVYEKFGFQEVKIQFSTRPEKRAGTDETWDKAEAMLASAVQNCGYEYTVQEGEGAFYGPKLEFQLRDAIGRFWQCGTLQLDFVLPERLGAKFINEKGERETPVMLHRAILGSIERFIGILIENSAGKLPVWLAPIQVALLTITNEVDDYGKQILAQLKAQGIRAILDTENATLNYKIRNHTMQKIPYVVILGKNEMENNLLSLRQENKSKNITAQELINLCIN